MYTKKSWWCHLYSNRETWVSDVVRSVKQTIKPSCFIHCQAPWTWNLHSGYFLTCSAALQCSVTASMRDLPFQNECCSAYSLAHSSQWFKYSAASVSLNVARQRGHCSSDRPGCLLQAEFVVDAAAAGHFCISAAVLNRGFEESFCCLEVILCPMCTRHTGTTSLFSLPASCWGQTCTVTVRTAWAKVECIKAS